jgi:hypothetical protein
MSKLPKSRIEQLLLLAGSSTFDGEALNALRAAVRLASANGQSLLEALRANTAMQLDVQRLAALEKDAYERGFRKGTAESGGTARRRPPSWPAFADALLQNHPRLLTEWEQGFLASFIAKGWPTPTVRQHAIFVRIATRCGEATP